MSDSSSGATPPGFYITAQRAGELLGVSVTHVHRLRKEGTILAVQDHQSKKWWVDGQSVNDHITALAKAAVAEAERYTRALKHLAKDEIANAKASTNG